MRWVWMVDAGNESFVGLASKYRRKVVVHVKSIGHSESNLIIQRAAPDLPFNWIMTFVAMNMTPATPPFCVVFWTITCVGIAMSTQVTQKREIIAMFCTMTIIIFGSFVMDSLMETNMITDLEKHSQKSLSPKVQRDEEKLLCASQMLFSPLHSATALLNAGA